MSMLTNMRGQKLLLVEGNRIFVPTTCRQLILSNSHKGHMGIVSTLNFMRTSYFWPGLRQDITNMVSNCMICLKHSPSLPAEAEVIDDDQPTQVMECLLTDFFHDRSDMYLLTIDIFSSYVFFTKFMGSPSSETVVATLNTLFLQVRYPRKP